jgi:hypothetical protein
MKRIVRLTESDLTRIVRRVISEQAQTTELDYAAIEMGSVELPNSISGFYKKSIATDSTGKKIIYGSTYQPETAKYQLKCYCADGKTTINGTPVKVLTPNWKRFC